MYDPVGDQAREERLMHSPTRVATALLTMMLLASASFSAMAGPAGDTPVLVDTRADLIREQQATIRQDLTAKRGRYKDMEPATAQRLISEQDKALRLLEGKTSSKELSRQDQVALFNALEAVSAIVNRAEEERMVCERVRRTGSNVSETICKTVAQRRAERELAGSSLNRRNSLCVTADCGRSGDGRPEDW
jgi:hypothetical protein